MPESLGRLERLHWLYLDGNQGLDGAAESLGRLRPLYRGSASAATS